MTDKEARKIAEKRSGLKAKECIPYKEGYIFNMDAGYDTKFTPLIFVHEKTGLSRVFHIQEDPHGVVEAAGKGLIYYG